MVKQQIRITLASIAALLVTVLPCFAKPKEHAPLPSRLFSAKTLFIENQASANMADYAYDELKKWNRFEIVTDRTKADLILSLSTKMPEHTGGNVSVWNSNGTYSSGHVSGGTPGYTYLTILDAKAGEPLYSDARRGIFGRVARNMIKDLQERIESQVQNNK
jgi:pimeloyl-CoA synthetase